MKTRTKISKHEQILALGIFHKTERDLLTKKMTKLKEKDEEETPSISLKRFDSKEDESVDESLMNREQSKTNLNDISLPGQLNLITR